MSNDQIIRSNKPHEVTIPEGSNNARSIRNKVGQRELEQEQEDRVTADKHYSDRTVHAESDAITDRLVEVENASGAGVDRVALEHQQSLESGRIQIDDTDATTDNRAHLDNSQDATHRVTLDTQADESPNRVKLPTSGHDDARVTLPSEEGRSDNRVSIAADAQSDNRALLPDESLADQRANLPSETQVDHRATLDTDAFSGSHVAIEAQNPNPYRATLQDDAIDSHSHVKEGATSSQPVKFLSDSIHDSFVTTPVMKHTESSPVKVDGHGITDPDSVIVESSPDPLGKVLVPHAQPEVSDPLSGQDEDLLAVAEDLTPPPVSALQHTVSAQVTAHLVDKKAEEFRGRVVKLRDEVDQLNRRLDEFKK